MPGKPGKYLSEVYYQCKTCNARYHHVSGKYLHTANKPTHKAFKLVKVYKDNSTLPRHK